MPNRLEMKTEYGSSSRAKITFGEKQKDTAKYNSQGVSYQKVLCFSK